jgi:hypothetical protein
MFYLWTRRTRLLSRTKRSKSSSADTDNRTAELSFDGGSPFCALGRFVQHHGMATILALFSRTETQGRS